VDALDLASETSLHSFFRPGQKLLT
jgi:hypothetical protein